jgi:hypothetical protein
MAAAASTTDLRTYQQRYDATARDTAVAANYGAALMTPEFNALRMAYDKQTAELRAIKGELRQAEKTRKAAPKANAKAMSSSAKRARRG